MTHVPLGEPCGVTRTVTFRFGPGDLVRLAHDLGEKDKAPIVWQVVGQTADFHPGGILKGYRLRSSQRRYGGAVESFQIEAVEDELVPHTAAESTAPGPSPHLVA